MKKMILSLAMLFIAGSAMAQKPCDGKNQQCTPEQKAAFVKKHSEGLAKRLMLDDATTAWFTPLYVEYLNKIHENCKDCKSMCCENATADADILKKMEECFDRQEKLLKIKHDYFKKFKQKLTPRQLQIVMKETCNKKGKNGKGFHKRAGKKGMHNMHHGKGMKPCAQGTMNCPQDKKDCNGEMKNCPQNKK